MIVRTIFSTLFCIITINSFAQRVNTQTFESNIDSTFLKSEILFLSDSLSEGRATGGNGNLIVRERLIRNFKQHNVYPLINGFYTQSFSVNGVIGRNVIGYVPSGTPTDKCIIICAHYDNIGILNDKLYPGADANASGTAAVLALSNAFGAIGTSRAKPNINIVFVLFDAKELSMAGSRYFASHLPVLSKEVICVINLDQIGAVLTPPHKEKNYLLALGKKYLPKFIAGAMVSANNSLSKPMDIDYSFYGSRAFHDTFYRLSDHYPLHKKNIPAIMLTSGINQNNYKPTDTEEFISYAALQNRVLFVYRLVCNLANGI